MRTHMRTHMHTHRSKVTASAWQFNGRGGKVEQIWLQGSHDLWRQVAASVLWEEKIPSGSEGSVQDERTTELMLLISLDPEHYRRRCGASGDNTNVVVSAAVRSIRQILAFFIKRLFADLQSSWFVGIMRRITLQGKVLFQYIFKWLSFSRKIKENSVKSSLKLAADKEMEAKRAFH